MVERQGWGEIKEGLGAPIIRVLSERRGQPTIVQMSDDSELLVYDGSGWGRDFDDMWEHVIARVTPLNSERQANDHHCFFLSEVKALLDSETRSVLISQTPAPGET